MLVVGVDDRMHRDIACLVGSSASVGWSSALAPVLVPGPVHGWAASTLVGLIDSAAFADVRIRVADGVAAVAVAGVDVGMPGPIDQHIRCSHAGVADLRRDCLGACKAAYRIVVVGHAHILAGTRVVVDS